MVYIPTAYVAKKNLLLSASTKDRIKENGFTRNGKAQVQGTTLARESS